MSSVLSSVFTPVWHRQCVISESSVCHQLVVSESSVLSEYVDSEVSSYVVSGVCTFYRISFYNLNEYLANIFSVSNVCS